MISYYRQPDGRMNEVVEMHQRVRNRHEMLASVILDFRDQKVLKASLQGTSIPKDWINIRDYYYQHYREIIDQLDHIWRPKSTFDTSQESVQ